MSRLSSWLVGAVVTHQSDVRDAFDKLAPLAQPELAAKMRVKAEPPRWPIKPMTLGEWREKWGIA
jgi:hypothetical protein